jgi:tetratricopeptide (TPR) repeat protein
MNKFLFFLIFLSTVAFSQENLNPVRHDAITEAWLTRDTESCFNKLIEAYKSYPDSFVLAYNLGYLSFLDGKMSQALDYFQDAKNLNPEYPYNYLMISKIYQQSGNLVSSNNVLQFGLEIESDNYDLLLELARISNKTDNTEKAIQIYSDLVQEYEDKFEPRVELTSIYRSQNKLDEAKSLLSFGDDEYPESIAVLEKYKTFRDRKDNGEAKITLLELLETYPNSEKFQKYIDTLQINYGMTNPPPPDKSLKYNYVLDPKEELNYLVEYGFLTLGWMKVRLEKEMIINGKKVYHIVFYIDSNPKYDFIISLHPIYESYIDAETLSAVRSRLYTPDGESNLVRMYYFDYGKNEFNSYRVKQDGRFELLNKDLPNAAQDGTSMLYLARGLVSNKSTGTTVVVVHEQYKFAVIDYLDESEEIEINDNDVITQKIFAQAKFSGIAGMNGDAYGWFSQDNNAVPLQGKIEIIVGSITVRIDDEKD